MKPGIPWSVKGIGNEAREAAKHAARRSGMTLGEWLNTVILESSGGEAPGLEPPKPAAGDLAARLGDIAQQLARLGEAQAPHEPEPAIDRTDAVAGEILSRLESGEQRTAEAISSLDERLRALGRRLEEAPGAPEVEDSPAYRALESALRSVIDHIEVSDRQTRDSLKSMQERLAAMAQRAQSAESEAVAQTAPALTRLEGRLAGMAERLERAEAAAEHGIPVIVQSELTRLAERIEAVRGVSELAAQGAAQAAAQGELRRFEARITGIAQEAQAAARGASGAGSEIKALRGEIGGLAQRLDDLKADSASERDLQALRVGLEQLSARIAQGPDLRSVSELERKLAELARRMDQGPGDQRLSARLSELDSRVAELDRRLKETVGRADDGRSARALEAQIAAVAERIAGAEQKLGQLATLDRTVSQLFEKIEQGRAFAKSVAEDAAGRMAERMMQAPPRDGRSEELKALERGLEAVKANAAMADRRTQETLEAVHETLEQIVNRLAEMEAQPAAAELAPAPLAVPAPPAAADDAWPQPRQPDADAASRPSPFADPLAPEPVTPDFSALPPVSEQPFPQDDFITAARRAAQAAAQRSALPTASRLGLVDKAKQKTLGFRLPSLSLPFTGRARQDPAPGAAKGVHYTVKDDGGRRRTLILAGLVLLAAVSAYGVSRVYDRPARAPALEAPAPAKRSPDAAPAPSPSRDSGMPAPETLAPEPESRRTGALPADNLLTGALPAAKQDASLASIIAEPGTVKSQLDMPPAETGPESLRQAARAGDPIAQFVIASRYLDGKEVEQDLTQAARWYQAAAEAGLAPAQYRLATLFERGRGVPRDLPAARLWYERAGERGNIKAMHNAAVIHAGREAGEPDYGKAARWFAAAAEHGLKDSQYNLAVLYERGLGVGPDGGEAMFWYALAGRQDDADAARRAEALAKTLPPDKVKSIEARLAAWRARPPAAQANVVAIGDPQWRQPGAAKPAPAAPPAAGDRAAVILRAQELLSDLGFKIGTPDGRLGARTANAIRLFEQRSGLKITGEATPELVARLESAKG